MVTCQSQKDNQCIYKENLFCYHVKVFDGHTRTGLLYTRDPNSVAQDSWQLTTSSCPCLRHLLVMEPVLPSNSSEGQVSSPRQEFHGTTDEVRQHLFSQPVGLGMSPLSH